MVYLIFINKNRNTSLLFSKPSVWNRCYLDPQRWGLGGFHLFPLWAPRPAPWTCRPSQTVLWLERGCVAALESWLQFYFLCLCPGSGVWSESGMVTQVLLRSESSGGWSHRQSLWRDLSTADGWAQGPRGLSVLGRLPDSCKTRFAELNFINFEKKNPLPLENKFFLIQFSVAEMNCIYLAVTQLEVTNINLLHFQ